MLQNTAAYFLCNITLQKRSRLEGITRLVAKLENTAEKWINVRGEITQTLQTDHAKCIGSKWHTHLQMREVCSSHLNVPVWVYAGRESQSSVSAVSLWLSHRRWLEVQPSSSQLLGTSLQWPDQIPSLCHFITELQGIPSTLSIVSMYFMSSTKTDLFNGIHIKATDISSFL